MSIDMLEQRPAEGDVDDLQPPADSKQRDSARACCANERDLERIARGVGRVDGLVARPTITCRIDVKTAAHHDPVEPLQVVAQTRRVVVERLGAGTMTLERCDVRRGFVDDLARRAPVAGMRYAYEGARVSS